MKIGSSTNLKSADKITFGVYSSKFRVIYEPLVACSSCLNGSEKNSLTQSLLMLGGHAVNNWTEKCTHLVMTSVTVTIKTLCALICCRSIIKPEYFSEMINAIQQKKPLPAPASFLPRIDEPSLQSESLDFSENAQRKTVFKDKTFFFLTAKQHKKLSLPIHLGGGKTKLLTGELDDTFLLENPNNCVIDVGMAESQLSESQDFPTWITSTLDILQSKGMRTVPEAEIGLAVIYMSTEIYCNPLQGSANRNKTEKNGRHNMGSIQSCSMAVDETVLPPATFNATAYVANTEPQDNTDNRMDVSGVREVKETPKSNSTSNKPNPRKDQEAGVSDDCRTALFHEQLQPSEERPRPLPQTPASNRQRASQKMSSNKMQNYFQPMSKKRDRNEEESESSAAKLSRMGKVTSRCSDPVKEIVPIQKNADIGSVYTPDTDLQTEPVVLSIDRLGSSCGRDNMDTSITSQPKDSFMKKRKEPEEVVEESDIEIEEECGDEMKDKNNTKINVSQVKRPRVETTEDLETPDRRARTTVPALGVQKIKTETDIKQEPISQHEDTKTPFGPKQENYNGLPSKVLVSEFRSLVVCRPARDSHATKKANQENVANFKKFRKIAYPGAGSFPHIIGGSDLIAHDRKKNSEIEQWLRQEMEEQTQQAREQSLADNLFRYNPKTVKRRR
ncbi:nibrin isoform X2 [Rhinoderma darwinii]